ncbi:MAG: pyroglutamyl-peptidase I [Rhizobacter sp.]
MSRRVLSEPTVLLTGFEPFAGAAVNASWLAVQALHGRQVAGCRVVSARLPTVFGDSLAQLNALLALHTPTVVLCVGLASGRRAISIERVAINVDDTSHPDNHGARPVDVPVVPHGPAAYFSSLPIKAMLRALQQQGLPAEVSQTAGTFVCNHVFYGLMHTLATEPSLAGTRGGFVHVPELDVLSLPAMVGCLHLLLDTAIRVRTDVQYAAGTLF